MAETGIVNIRGKEYRTVALRVSEFRETHPIDDGWAIVTEELPAADDCVKVCASILDPQGRQVATGLAEEKRGASQINRTSALENCETSAIGRALANAGYGGSEYASANEVENAVHQQDAPPPPAESPRDVIAEAIERLLTKDRDLVKAYDDGVKTLADARRAALGALTKLKLDDEADAEAVYRQLRGFMNSVVDERAAADAGF